MSQSVFGPEQQKVAASLDDMVRWHRQTRGKDGRMKPIPAHRMIVNAIDQGPRWIISLWASAKMGQSPGPEKYGR